MIDNKAEKYAATSPYTYALNNPILFLDPDGNEVKIYNNMSPVQVKAMLMFMKTDAGRNYLSQFLKNDESVSWRGYTITGKTNGKYSNSTVHFFASNLESSTIGRTYSMHKGKNGQMGEAFLETHRPVVKSDVDKLKADGSFEVGIALNSNMTDRTSDQWAETLGHEVFGHSTNNAATISKVLKILKEGGNFGDVDDILQRESTNTIPDHNAMTNGLNEDYNQYMKNLEENKKKDEDEENY